MTTIHHEILADSPPERVWALFADLEAVQHHNPGVRHAAVEGALRQAVGLELESHDWPVNFMCWATRIEPHEGGTRITQSLEYQVKFRPFGWLLDQMVMKRKLTTTLDTVFASLARHAERSPSGGTTMGRS